MTLTKNFIGKRFWCGNGLGRITEASAENRGEVFRTGRERFLVGQSELAETPSECHLGN